MNRSLTPLAVLFATAILATRCNRDFNFDVPVAQGGASGDAGTAGAPSGGSTYTAVTYPNLDECTYHCKEHGLVCATQWLCCVECSADSDCTQSARSRCDTVLHRCIECGSNLDCPLGSICEQKSRRCVQSCDDTTTTVDAGVTDDLNHCPTGETCNVAAKHCAACTSNADCATSAKGHKCQPTMQQCVRCLTQTDCGGTTPFCDPVEYSCVVCRDSADCASGHCDPLRHKRSWRRTSGCHRVAQRSIAVHVT